MRLRKLTALLLGATMILGLTACKDKNNPRPSNYIIGENDPWYIRTDISIKNMLDSDTDDFRDANTKVCTLDDQLLVLVAGNKNSGSMEAGIKMGLMRMSGILNSETTYMAGDESRNIQALGGYREDADNIAVLFADTASYEKEARLRKLVWNTGTDTFSEPEIIEENIGLKDGISFGDSIGDYTVIQNRSTDEDGDATGDNMIWILDKDRVIETIDLKDTPCFGFDLNYIGLRDGLISFYGSISYDTVSIFADCPFVYDTASDTLKYNIEFTKGEYFYYQSFEDYYNSSDYDYPSQMIGDHEYRIHEDGIYMDGELYLSFIDYGLEFYNLIRPEIAYVDEERVIILADDDWYYSHSVSRPVFSNRPLMIKIEKLSDNPNAGKEVINALSISCPDRVIMDGIREYNNGDHDFIIKCRVEDLSGPAYDTIESASNRFNELEELLTSDNGPDIVFNAHLLPNLNDQLFKDLKHKNKLSKKDFYTNVSDLCKIDGDLYYIPLTYSISGITVLKEYVDKGRTGFTYDDYEDILNGLWEGGEPMYTYPSEINYIDAYLPSLVRPVIKKGKVSFDEDELRKSLEFIKDHDFATNYDERTYYSGQAWYQTCYDEEDYPLIYGDEDFSFCAVPTYKGTGPCASIRSSVSICAQTGMTRSCVEFVNSLFEPVVYLGEFSFTISKEADKIKLSESYQRDFWSISIDEAKSNYLTNTSDEGYKKYDENKMAMLTDLQKNVGSIECHNQLYRQIIIEHTLSYLDGTKDLDQTIDAIRKDLDKYFN